MLVIFSLTELSTSLVSPSVASARGQKYSPCWLLWETLLLDQEVWENIRKEDKGVGLAGICKIK